METKGFFQFGIIINVLVSSVVDAGALVQWLKLPPWNVGDRGFEPRSGIQV